MKKYLILAMLVVVIGVGCGEKEEEINFNLSPNSDILIDSGATDEELIDSGFITDLDLKGAVSFTFELQDRSVEIDLEDFKSMTAQELRDFSMLMNLVINISETGSYFDSEMIEIWGMKLLPRFFKPTEILSDGKTIDMGLNNQVKGRVTAGGFIEPVEPNPPHQSEGERR